MSGCQADFLQLIRLTLDWSTHTDLQSWHARAIKPAKPPIAHANITPPHQPSSHGV